MRASPSLARIPGTLGCSWRTALDHCTTVGSQDSYSYSLPAEYLQQSTDGEVTGQGIFHNHRKNSELAVVDLSIT